MSAIHVSRQTTPMEGNGFYNKASQVQASGIARGLATFKDAAEAVAKQRASEKRPVRFMDLGCSQGKNSIPLVQAVVEATENHSENLHAETPVEVVHMDLPENDWNSVMRVMQGSEYPKSNRLFASCRGGTFYEQQQSDDSVDLVWTSHAMHWMSMAPEHAPLDHLYYVNATNEENKKIWKAQSDLDYLIFLLSRQNELRVGGQAVHVELGIDEFGLTNVEGFLDIIHESAMEALDHQWGVAVPMIQHSREDLVKPFAYGQVPFLKLISCEITQAKDPNYLAYLEDGDLEAFVEKQFMFTKAAALPSLRLTPEQEVTFENAFKARVRADPGGRGKLDYNIAIMKYAKTQDVVDFQPRDVILQEEKEDSIV